MWQFRASSDEAVRRQNDPLKTLERELAEHAAVRIDFDACAVALEGHRAEQGRPTELR